MAASFIIPVTLELPGFFYGGLLESGYFMGVRKKN